MLMVVFRMASVWRHDSDYSRATPARSRYQRALSFGVRVPVAGSTRMMPNFFVQPDAHSRLSSRLHA